MSLTLSRTEALLLGALALLALWAGVGPLFGLHLAQAPHIHDYADQRAWLGLPCALDVLSNLPFALFGLWGPRVLGRVPAAALDGTQRALAALFFTGLVLTAFASGWYHGRADDAGLFIDRVGMSFAFAGLLGLAVASRITARAGAWTAPVVLLWGVLGAWVCWKLGNLLPWAVLQGAGLALLLVLSWLHPRGLAVRWWLIIVIYAAAKLCELADHVIYEATGQLISGHSLKHLVAAFAAWPVIRTLQQLGQNARQ
ncbi:MAG TPA: hypothetical protein DDX06_06565 [Curvibacter sp.]|nr:hypothetical protein [Curvibacter sp.]